jgi:hypothetical protein
VEGGRRGRDTRTGQARHDPGAQLLGGLAAEGEHQHLIGTQPASLHPVSHELDQRRGLAGARSCQDQQRTTRVVDDGLLGCVEGDGNGCRTGRST